MSEAPFRWAILGLGHIARSFAAGLRDCPGATLIAGASRSRERADAFGREFNVPRCYDSYEQLYADPEVDAIYIATRHPDHACAALAAIRAGKPVLVEKPFTVNAREAAEVVKAAREQKVFCMEAMWTRFLPLMEKLKQLIQEDTIGEVRLIQADFSFNSAFDPSSRIFDPKLGGGALLDVGVYPISFASMLLGRPVEATGLATIGETGVDEQATMAISYGAGALASLSCGTRARSQHQATIVGTKGCITIHPRWWVPRSMTITRAEQQDEHLEVPFDGNGYNYEAAEVMRCVRASLIESPMLPMDETLDVMRTMDTLRRQWGLRYEADDQSSTPY